MGLKGDELMPYFPYKNTLGIHLIMHSYQGLSWVSVFLFHVQSDLQEQLGCEVKKNSFL